MNAVCDLPIAYSLDAIQTTRRTQTLKLSTLDTLSLLSNARPLFDMTYVPTQHSSRSEVEAFIQQVFKQHHQANITEFLPHLLAAKDTDGHITSAVGFRFADKNPLFLEKYIDQPIESLIDERFAASLLGAKTQRKAIVEVGNLCCKTFGGCALIFQTLSFLLHQLGTQWVVFTGTEVVRKNFNRLGIQTIPIATADKAKLGHQQAAWGSYYDNNPIVMLCNVAAFIHATPKRLSLHVQHQYKPSKELIYA
ncbi:MAG: thermostable hemolysin [Formosimonas sp.]